MVSTEDIKRIFDTKKKGSDRGFDLQKKSDKRKLKEKLMKYYSKVQAQEKGISSNEISRILEEKRKVVKKRFESGIPGSDFKKICLICGIENSEKAKFCIKCGNLLKEDLVKTIGIEENLEGKINYYKDSENFLAYFEGDRLQPNIEITTEFIRPWHKSKLTGKLTGKFDIYNKDKIKNLTVSNLNQIIFDYEGKLVSLNLKNKEFAKKAKELFENSEYVTFNKEYRKKPGLNGTDEDSRCKVVVTHQEDGLILNRKGAFLGGNKGSQFIKYADIASIGFKKGLVSGQVEIMVPGGKIVIKKVNPKLGNMFVSAVQEKIMEAKSKTEVPVIQEQVSPMEEIKKAKELLDMGAITKEEFEKIKNNYLKQI